MIVGIPVFIVCAVLVLVGAATDNLCLGLMAFALAVILPPVLSAWWDKRTGKPQM